MDGIGLIAEERTWQIKKEGWTAVDLFVWEVFNGGLPYR